jgi:hypothetical protein
VRISGVAVWFLSLTAVPAAAAYSQSPFWGIKLSRDEALAHPRIDEFWEIVDYVLLTDPVVHAHVYGHELSTLARQDDPLF